MGWCWCKYHIIGGQSTPRPQVRGEVTAPDGVVVTVTPTQLAFNKDKEQKMYTVEFSTGAVKPEGTWEFSEIVWMSLKNRVRSPMAVAWLNN